MPRATESPRPTPGVEFGDEHWPIVVLRIHAHVELADVDRAYDFVEACARRGEPHVHWTDLRGVNPLALRGGAMVRKRFAERERALIPIARGLVVADVRIVDDAIVRGFITAFEWLVGETPWPVRNVATRALAIEWLRETGILDRLEIDPSRVPP